MTDAGHRFSKRTGWDLTVASYSGAIAAARAAGRALIDLTVSNPTRCGFDYDPRAVLDPISGKQESRLALTYDPNPRGMVSAREAVVRYYADHHAAVDAGSLLLTTSTSEAYSFLFRLLCDAGDEVLVGQPSYPLFEFLADLDDVVLKHYPLFYDFGWWIDFAELERRIGPRTRAILVVHPNNPTGHWTHRPERQKLEALCALHGLALIVDEVFLDYPITSSNNPRSNNAGSNNPGPNDPRASSFACGPHPALTFVLSGISKICALPQMKIAWLAVQGPEQAAEEALRRLETISDTFLSMNSPAQLALPWWLADRDFIQAQIRRRIEANLAVLRAGGLEVMIVEAGWSAVVHVRTPSSPPYDSPAVMLLERASVVVHPGEFYGLAKGREIVLSLLTPVESFAMGVRRISEVLRDLRLGGHVESGGDGVAFSRAGDTE